MHFIEVGTGRPAGILVTIGGVMELFLPVLYTLNLLLEPDGLELRIRLFKVLF